MPRTIAVLGTLDTKGAEHAFVAEQIRQAGLQTLLIDVGCGTWPTIKPDITRDQVAEAAGIDLAQIQSKNDRGQAVAAMVAAAPILLEKLCREGKIDGVISLGGGGGTAIAAAAMRALPIGFPKLIVSTLASGNTAHYVGTKDIVMIPSIVDIAGLNRLSKLILSRAAGAIIGMVNVDVTIASDKPLIVASMFGNTTACVNQCKAILEQAGFEVLTFAATGSGGKAMESLIESGLVAGVLDITTTELADELVGGVLSAGPDRLKATATAQVPSIVVPGCLDMVNFGERATVPAQFKHRRFYQHNPQVTLMRTNVGECRELGKWLATAVNRFSAPTTVLIPKQAISVISAPGGPFHDIEADQALFESIQGNLDPRISCESYDLEINSPEFAKLCTVRLLQNMQWKTAPKLEQN